MKYKNGETAKAGDIIRWKCSDRDDFVTWTFTGLVRNSGVVYLGGGVDFGMSIGAIKTFDNVIGEAEDNEPYDAGIEKIGTASELYKYISDFNGSLQTRG